MYAIKRANLHWLGLAGILVVANLLFVGCMGTDAGKGAKGVLPTPAPTPVALARVPWCGGPAMIFRDDAASVQSSATPTPTPVPTLGPANGTPTTITDWNLVKANLGFTVFLPTTIAAGSCLLNAASTLRQPVLGSNFAITYMLANHDSITFSQAPLSTQNTTFQCNVAASTTKAGGTTPTVTTTSVRDPVQLCSGVRSTTNIVFSARGKTSALEQLFRSLQPNVNWIPIR